jgi:hypothetical protein
VATPVQCTAFFGSDSGKGWSESHHLLSPVDPGDLLPILQDFKTLIDNQRRPLLGSDCYVKGLRVSYPTASGSIASSPYRYTPYSYPSTKREGAAPSVSAKVRMGESLNQQFSDIHLRGFWDAVEANEQLDFSTAAGAAWKSLLDAYVAALVAGQYGWLGISDALSRRGVVRDYTTDADGFITFQLDNIVGPPLPAVGTPLEIRFAKINHSNSVLNRTMVVTVDGVTTVKTAVPTAALAFDSKGTFVIRGLTFLQYTGMQYVILGKRSMGRPTLQSATRLKDRPRG